MMQINLSMHGSRTDIIKQLKTAADILKVAADEAGPFELLEKAGLLVLESELDDGIDAHIDIPTVVDVVEKTMQAYDLLDRTLQAPLFAKQLDFHAWWQTLEAT